MPRVQHHGNPFGVDGLFDSICYLFGHLLLDLEAAGKDVDDAGDLGETDYFAVGDVCYVRPADDREHMVFTHGIKLDISDKYHFIVAGSKKGLIEYLARIPGVAFGKKTQSFGDTVRCLDESFSVGIFSYLFQDSFYSIFQNLVVIVVHDCLLLFFLNCTSFYRNLGKITHYFTGHQTTDVHSRQRKIVKVESKRLDDANILISGEISREDIDSKIDKIARDTGRQIKVDGFRKGKVPVHVVKKLYGDKLSEDAEGESLREMLNGAYTQAGISTSEIIGDPIFKKYDKKDDGVEVEIQICLHPKVDTKDYKKAIPEFKVPEVSENEVKERIDALLGQVAPLVSITDDRALQNGDTAVFDFEGFVDGEAFEGGKAENYELEIGSGRFIPGFEEGMIGMKKGEEKTVKVKFPDDYQAENLKGKDAEFVVKLHDIKAKGKAKLDDDAAKKITNDQDATVETLKASTKEQIKSEKISKRYNEEVKPELVEALVAHFEFALPENIVEQEIDNLVNQKAQNMTKEEIKAIQEDSAKLDALRDEVREDATNSVKATFIVDALAKEEKLSVNDDEVNQVLYYEALMSGQNPDEVIKYYTENNLMPAVKMSLLEDKLYSRLLGLDKL